MASYGLLKGVGGALTKTADDIGQRLREERVRQFQMNMQDRGFEQQQQMREGDRAYQDQVREEQRGLLQMQRTNDRAIELQDMARQDSNVSSWGTAVDGDTQYQVGYSRTGDEVARHEAGPAPQGESGLQWKDKAIPMGQDLEGNTIYGPGWVNPADGSVIPPRAPEPTEQERFEAIRQRDAEGEYTDEEIWAYIRGDEQSLGDGSGSGQGTGEGSGEETQTDMPQPPPIEGFEYAQTPGGLLQRGLEGVAGAVGNVVGETKAWSDADWWKGHVNNGRQPRYTPSNIEKVRRAVDSDFLDERQRSVAQRWLERAPQ